MSTFTDTTREGDTVRVTEGAWKGRTGEVVKVLDHRLLFVEMDGDTLAFLTAYTEKVYTCSHCGEKAVLPTSDGWGECQVCAFDLDLETL